MTKPEWGSKHRCVHCGSVFYDMQRDPILCPGCGKTHQPEVLLKSRRSRTEEKIKVPVPAKVPVAVVLDEAADEDEDLDEDETVAADLIEDAAELEDGDDNAPVVAVVDNKGTD